ncbi:MAG: signal peptide peptidase SppA [Planctomycetaceae bacterium]|jgi:protease-4|nr:signal peptide peptidase SppA [Planctomycetaceae bacterium]
MSQDQTHDHHERPAVVYRQPSGGSPAVNGCLPGLLSFFLKIAVICIVMAGCFSMLGYLFHGDAGFEVTEKHVSGPDKATDKIAVITLSGVIVGDEEGSFIKQLNAAETDPKVKAVVLRIDSPGGTVSGSDYYHHKIQQFKANKNVPVVVSMGSMATSGGYYLSVTGQEIFAERTTTTGSIGVIASLYDFSELCDKIGLHSNPVTSGPMKSMGDPTRKMTPEEKEVFQQLIDDMFLRFKEVVHEGRPQLTPAKIEELATGQVYTALQAVDNGLVDKIGFVEDAVSRAGELANLSAGSYKTVKYVLPKTAMDYLLGSKSQEVRPSAMLSPELANNLVTPRFYYIFPRAVPIVGGK